MEREHPQDWTENAEAGLDRAEEAGDEARLAALEDMNERLEAELDQDRPRPAAGGEGADAGGEAQSSGR